MKHFRTRIQLYTSILILFLLSSCSENTSKSYRNDKNEGNAPITHQYTDSVRSEPITKNLKENSLLQNVGDSLLKHPISEPNLKYKPYYHLSSNQLKTEVYFKDTIMVQTAEELMEQIRNNRCIILNDGDYILPATLKIDSISSLKIMGSNVSRIYVKKQDATTISIDHSNNISLKNVIIGKSHGKAFSGEQGTLFIQYSFKVKISNCQLNGSGTTGLRTYAVYDLQFLNSEIVESSNLIFDLERSRNFRFINSNFQNNQLHTSVLGGFSNASKELYFEKCKFLNNCPNSPGNPAFNQSDQYDPILFINCIFKNNKGFKWYDDFIQLENCQIDSTDFIGW